MTDSLQERLRTDAEYCASRVGASVRQIGRDCAEAADALDAAEARIAEARERALEESAKVADDLATKAEETGDG